MIRWLIRDGIKVLQQWNCSWGEEWIDVPEITENEALIKVEQEKERQRLESERIMEQLKGKGYFVR